MFLAFRLKIIIIYKLWSNSVSICFNSDYHKKQNTIAALRKKAMEKNPDEFYFNMINSQLQVTQLKYQTNCAICLYIQ